MNDKINELACKAYNTDPIPVGWVMSEKAMQMFATMIVYECMDHVVKLENNGVLYASHDGKEITKTEYILRQLGLK